MNNVVETEIRSQLPRLLSLTDRNPCSPTYGCLSRPYWHDKLVGFPNAHAQSALLVLALAAQQGHPAAAPEELRPLARAALGFWAAMQRPDGSFDEHYQNEHSYGAAAWTTAAVIPAARLVHGRELPDALEKAIRNSARFLCTGTEPGRLANHKAIGACALLDAGDYLAVPQWTDRGRALVGQLIAEQDPEGWFMEYDGCDPGYLTVSLSYLTRAYDRHPDPALKAAILRGIAFFSTIVFRDGWSGGPMGSRGSTHLYPLPFARWSGESDDAAAVLSVFTASDSRLQLPSAMDDKHFGNLLTDYWLAAALPWKTGPLADGEWYHPGAGLWCRRAGGQQAMVAFKNGGAIRARGGVHLSHYGYTLTDSRGKSFTSLGASTFRRQGDTLTVHAPFRPIPRNTLTGSRRLALALFVHTLGRNRRLSLWFKKQILRVLILTPPSAATFTREIDLATLTVRDQAPPHARPLTSWPGRFVPSSRFFVSD